MKYVLENKKEFERLEKQSASASYDIPTELQPILNQSPRRILDAGCGSGIVSRFLSNHFKNAVITGCDFSADRIQHAKNTAQAHRKLDFCVQDLKKLSFLDQEFDLIVCRYVLQHLNEETLLAVMNELFRCTQPGGVLCTVDIDGGFHNLYPMPPFIAETLALIDLSQQVDQRIGRKLPSRLLQSGFSEIQSSIQTLSFLAGTSAMEEEASLIEQRLNAALEFLARLLKSKTKAERFRDEYLQTLACDGTVLFFNKFIVHGTKPKGGHLKRVK